jgi:hypothetical protein
VRAGQLSLHPLSLIYLYKQSCHTRPTSLTRKGFTASRKPVNFQIPIPNRHSSLFTEQEILAVLIDYSHFFISSCSFIFSLILFGLLGMDISCDLVNSSWKASSGRSLKKLFGVKTEVPNHGPHGQSPRSSA